jgi:hypothetical protein
LGGVNFGDLDLSFKRTCGLVPLRFKGFAVAAPRCVELDQPNVFGTVYETIEVGFIENNDVFVSDGFLLLLLFLLLFLLS